MSDRDQAELVGPQRLQQLRGCTEDRKLFEALPGLLEDMQEDIKLWIARALDQPERNFEELIDRAREVERQVQAWYTECRLFAAQLEHQLAVADNVFNVITVLVGHDGREVMRGWCPDGVGFLDSLPGAEEGARCLPVRAAQMEQLAERDLELKGFRELEGMVAACRGYADNLLEGQQQVASAFSELQDDFQTALRPLTLEQ